MRLSSEEVLAAATGSTGGYGKIATVPNAGIIYVRCDCGAGTGAVVWQVQCDQAHAVQKYRSRDLATGATITLTDATAVDDGDTFVLNGLTFTAEATEGDADASARKYWTGASNAAAAANLAALLIDDDYGVPGLASATVAAVDATDVITLVPDFATVLQFSQGTSAANEIAWSETTLASLAIDGAAVTAIAANNTTLGTLYKQDTYGCPYAYLGLTNSSGAAAATFVVKATRLTWDAV